MKRNKKDVKQLTDIWREKETREADRESRRKNKTDGYRERERRSWIKAIERERERDGGDILYRDVREQIDREKDWENYEKEEKERGK